MPLLVIRIVLAVNTLRLFRGRRRREPALYDGSSQGHPVTRFDVFLSAALAAAALAACAVEWWRAR